MPKASRSATIGGELIGGRQDREISLRHPQQQILLRAAKAGLGGGGLEIRFLQLAEGLEAPQGLRQVEPQAVRRAVAMLRCRRWQLMAQSAAWLPVDWFVVEAGALPDGRRSGRHLRQPLRERLRSRFDGRVALESGGLQRGVARQRELVEILQIVGCGQICRQSHRDQRR